MESEAVQFGAQLGSNAANNNHPAFGTAQGPIGRFLT